MWPRCGHRRAAASTRTWPDTSLGIAAQHGRLRERPAGADIVGDDLDGTIERAVAGKPEHKVDVVLLTEIHHFRAAQGDSGSGPVPADAAYEPAQMASDLLTGRRLAGAQQHRQRPTSRNVVDM